MTKSVQCIQTVIAEIMINDKPNEVIEKFFESLLKRYQFGLEASMRGSDISFDCVHINFKWYLSYIDFSDWIQNKKQ